MKRMKFKWLSVSLILAMFLSLVAPLSAFAAALTIVKFNYVSAEDPRNVASPNVDQFTTNGITITAIVDGIADDQVKNVYYEVTNKTTGISYEEKTNKPVQNPSNLKEISFNNVYLTDGLNQITLKFGQDTTVISSVPAWAYYTSTTNISDLQINGDPLVDVVYPFNGTGMFPKTPPYTGVTITGNANNANGIEATFNGNDYQPTSFYRNKFTYIANTGRTNDLNLVPGDNKVSFYSANDVNSYSMQRKFIYDNGKAFAFNARVAEYHGAASKPLVETPTIETLGNRNVTFTALLKTALSKDTFNNSVTDYVYADIYLVNNYKVHYDFATNSVTTVGGGTLNSNDPAAHSFTGRYNDPDGKFIADGVQIDLPVNVGTRSQKIYVAFTPRDGSKQVETSEFTFSFVKTNDPYVQSVQRETVPGTWEDLVEVGTTQINVLPSKLQVNAPHATSVDVYINGTLYGNYPTTADKAIIDLANITDGSNLIQVIPYSGTDKFTAGEKSYQLTINGTAYVLLNEIYDGQVVCGVTGSTGCSEPLPATITGSIKNLPDPSTAIANNLVNLYLNDVDITSTIQFNADNSGAFTITPNQDFNNAFTTDGKKTLRFEINIGGAVVQSSYDIFVFRNKLPYIDSYYLDFLSNDSKYKKGTQPDTYSTTSTKLTLKGRVYNAQPSEIKINYTKPGSTTSTNPALSTTAGPNYIDFTLDLTIGETEYGIHSFNLSVTTVSGASTSRTITVSKEPLSYEILKPDLVKNLDGVDQANINKNFQKIEILADKADSVLIGKEEAVKTKTTDGQDLFKYEALNLKAGKNEIKFTVVRGTAKTNGSFILYNVDTPNEGNQYKAKLASKMKVFNGELELSFPKDTKLMRNELFAENQYITSERSLLFGIASNLDGRVDKVEESQGYKDKLNEPTGHFKPASKRYWIDAGTIADDQSPENMKEAMYGSGRLPYEQDENSAYRSGEYYNRDIRDEVIPTKRGELTIKYDDSIRDDAWKYLTVYHFTNYTNNNGDYNSPGNTEWRNIGGVVDPKKNTITVPVDSFGYYQVMYMDSSFRDVTGHPWARDYLDIMYSKGIMRNKDTFPKEFKPDEAITRGEFVSVLVDIFDIPLENESTSVVNQDDTQHYDGTFSDVRRGNSLNSNGLYDFMHIEAAARAGIARGSNEGYFGHDQPITRQDAAVMLARAADLKMNSDDAKVLAALQKQFTDANSIEYYARPAVDAAVKAGYIDGIANTLLEGQKKETYRFSPTDNFTRAQAAAIAVRVLKQLKKIPK